MSKINQIQRALLEMSGGEFQKLADAYLTEKGVEPINSIGSVIGANKTKAGTPDTLISMPEGGFIFVEHTTRQEGLLGKMKDDLEKCFDENKTGIPVERIERVIFCFTGTLDARQQSDLAETCQEKNVDLHLYGIEALSFDLYKRYPALARDFLGISIDTGQIVPPEQFVSLYNRNMLATRLDLDFHFREEELGRLLGALEAERLVVLSGRAGIGKTRLALEVCGNFSEAYPEYEVHCIYGRNMDLWEDLKTRFSKSGHFLILVDDANRVSKFDYVVDLIQHQREDQCIKVVASVRDYALAKVREAARPLGGHYEEELELFNDEQIKALIADEYGIVNSIYQERVADIARGNPRLAVMAAELAKEGPLSSIHDVSALYDNYFASIRKDLSGEGADPGSADLLRTAAIVSFFKAVDRTNEEMTSAVEKAFGITLATFWESADRLHEMEILDMHEDEVVRVSDQVLGTYLFYLASFKEEVLDFGVLLRHFFPKLRHRLVDSISPVLNAFDTETIIDAMQPYVEEVRKELEAAGDMENLFLLLDVFWFTSRTDTLLWLRDRIDELEPEPAEIASVTFEEGSDSPPSPSILSVLKQFAVVGGDETRMALSLLLEYLAKRPAETPTLLQVLISGFGFRFDSFRCRFEVQRAVVDELSSRADSGDPIFLRTFIAVASSFLGTYFENHEMRPDGVIQIRRFGLPATPDLAALREAIWKRLYLVYEQEELRDEVLGVVRRYIMSSSRETSSEIVKADGEHVLPFLDSVLDPGTYSHCDLMHDYIDLLEKHGGEAPENLGARFCNDTYAVAEVILPEWGERRTLDLTHEEYEEFRRNRLAEYTASFEIDDYVLFIERCLEIRGTLDERRHEYQIQSGAVIVFLALADRNPDLYRRVLASYLELQDPLQLFGHSLIQKLVEQRGFAEATRLLCEPEYPTKTRWLFHVYEVLPASEVDEDVLAQLYELYEAAGQADLPHHLDFLLNYIHLDPRVVAKIVSRVLETKEEDAIIAGYLEMLFNPVTGITKRLPELFAEDLDLLKRAYLVVDCTPHHSDFRGQVFNHLLDLDPDFAADYIEWKYENAERGWVSSHDDHRDYSFIWLRSDHQEVMDKIVESVYAQDQIRFTFLNPYLERFFATRGDGCEPEERFRKLQDTYLLRLIDLRSGDANFMEYLFSTIGHFSAERRRKLIERFVQRNRSVEAFKRLPMEPSGWSWTGSQVPVLQERVDFWESLLPILNTVDLLQHRQSVERQIQGLRGQIEYEKKKDFVGD